MKNQSIDRNEQKKGEKKEAEEKERNQKKECSYRRKRVVFRGGWRGGREGEDKRRTRVHARKATPLKIIRLAL